VTGIEEEHVAEGECNDVCDYIQNILSCLDIMCVDQRWLLYYLS
jgi:hypothetical protein